MPENKKNMLALVIKKASEENGRMIVSGIINPESVPQVIKKTEHEPHMNEHMPKSKRLNFQRKKNEDSRWQIQILRFGRYRRQRCSREIQRGNRKSGL